MKDPSVERGNQSKCFAIEKGWVYGHVVGVLKRTIHLIFDLEMVLRVCT